MSIALPTAEAQATPDGWLPNTKMTAKRLPPRCPVCRSPLMTYARTFPRRIGGEVDVFFCMECESASSPFSPEMPPADVTAWHVSVHDRNVRYGTDLFKLLDERGVFTGPLTDIGCGIGTLLTAAKAMGVDGVGYDLNEWACAYGRDNAKHDLRSELWRRDSTPGAKLYTCIMVLEHIHQPWTLIKDMVGAAQDADGALYISVPFFERANWRALRTDNLAAPGHFFEYPHVHVTHFSQKGLQMALKKAGAKTVEILKSPGWWGCLAT